VLLHPATAVTQAIYESFARYLAGLGLHVLTYDYRGTGASRGASLRGETVTMADWMLEDVGGRHALGRRALSRPAAAGRRPQRGRPCDRSCPTTPNACARRCWSPRTPASPH
jgi:hypothetical protein